jgi:hypothetical protein
LYYNNFEEELDAIRAVIYEKIKDMTYEEISVYIKAKTAPIRAKYHIRTVSNAFPAYSISIASPNEKNL